MYPSKYDDPFYASLVQEIASEDRRRDHKAEAEQEKRQSRYGSFKNAGQGGIMPPAPSFDEALVEDDE